MVGSILALLLSLGGTADFDMGTASLTINDKGVPCLRMEGESAPWSTASPPLCRVASEGGMVSPETVTWDGERLRAEYPGGGVCELAVHPNSGFILFEVLKFEFPSSANSLELCSLALPEKAELMPTLNAAGAGKHTVALSAAEPNVHAFSDSPHGSEADRAGCSHALTPSSDAKVGVGAAQFNATSDGQAGGWSCVARSLPAPMDLTGMKAIRAWVHGDGKGEILKIQLYDGMQGYRDTCITIDFEGWRQLTVAESPYNTLNPSHVTALDIYYNGLPGGQSVSCGIDQVEAILERDGAEENVVLENFEPSSPYWIRPPDVTLNIETIAAHGVLPARFALLVCPRADFMNAMERFEEAAALPMPKPGGAWNKQSPWIKRSYLFITSFKASQFDPVLALAKRGGFDMIVMGQESWTKAAGHYEINTNNFPNGLEQLAQTFHRFREEGFHAGLHVLGASIDPPDAYITPAPDPRLVHDAKATLSENIDASASTLPLTEAPSAFPAEDGGYMGSGAVIQIGDELISYSSRSTNAPFVFADCQRGIFGTVATGHAKGDELRHLKKAYGYFLFDMDTSLLDEVTSNFARIANACDTDMIYFDGSENFQGDHWFYNAKLHSAVFDKLAKKDILMQASSYSHYSWHLLARSASADGHGDLKGYLDERSAQLDAMNRDSMPLDIGWYYGYDASCTPDMYEYVLGASIGYDSSISFQDSLEAAENHPFTGEILDLIARYEKLRLSGRVPADMRARLRIDPALAGVMQSEKRDALLDKRREYRLLNQEGKDVFQRVEYEPWRELKTPDEAAAPWTVRVPEDGTRIGVQIQVEPGAWGDAGASYHAENAFTLESFDDLASYAAARDGRTGLTELKNGETGSTSEGVSQDIRLSGEDVKEGGHCLIYSAENGSNTDGGWSVFGKHFDPPLDIAWSKALGFWMRGDGNGGLFKVQLLDNSKAADFYIANDYSGWRYQQLARPDVDPIDYSKVRALNFYYNGLPANKAVACAIDDLKALPAMDLQTLTDPWCNIAGQRIEWKGELREGQYLFLWPGETAKLYGPKFHEPTESQTALPSFTIGQGEHSVQFGCAGKLSAPLRIRVTLQPPERYNIE
jgi:hypothetical protein